VRELRQEPLRGPGRRRDTQSIAGAQARR
jgi:hypothetical protein